MSAVLKLNEAKYEDLISRASFQSESGLICKNVGLTFEGYLPGARLGSLVTISSTAHETVEAEVIGFRDKRVILMAMDETRGINVSSRIEMKEREPFIPVGPFMIGRVIDAKCQPLDGKGPLIPRSTAAQKKVIRTSIYSPIHNPMSRALIKEPLDLGIKAMNGLLTCGKGQRLGIMAGSGVGKSTLLGMMARNARADVNVIALIGERGREVREFIEKDLGPEGLKRSVVVVVTGDKSPLLRVRGAFVAAAIAEQFCGMGADVLLMMDSVTRFCMAQREIGLSIGEPPASKGYTPSVFAMLPRLLERSGAWEGKGSITGLYTVLVDGDDMDEPIADAARSILDGHIVLSRQLAARNHYPPIDVLNSVSRCMSSVSTKQHLQVASELRELMAVYQTNEDLINIGAYVRGANPKLDQAVGAIDRIRAFLRQRVDEPSNLEQSAAMMQSILAAAGVAIPR
jgi:flagellum-specific ATP synthase